MRRQLCTRNYDVIFVAEIKNELKINRKFIGSVLPTPKRNLI